MEMMKTTAILTAGGVGSRMQKNIPKQFLTVKNIPIIIYTLQQFQNNKNIDEIVIACLKEWQPMLRAYVQEFTISKVISIVDGGETGIDSITNCFNEIEHKDGIVVIHDGNRPLVSDSIIDRNLEMAKEYGATSTYIDIHDGIIKVDADLNALPTDIRRQDIKSTQTPHAFQYTVLRRIVDEITDSSLYISFADAALKLGHDIGLVEGSETNFKITTKNDLAIFEAMVDERFKGV